MESGSVVHKTRGLVRTIRRYKNWKQLAITIAKGHQPTTVTLRNGIRIDAPEDGVLLGIVNDIFFRNVYNPVDLPIEANDIVVDIGAHIGVFTIFAACRTQNTVYAFEPFPRNIEFLNRNVSINGLPNVTTHCVAVSEKTGSAKLYLREFSARHMLFDHNIKGKLEKYVEVPTTTLQRIVDDNSLGQIDFLKLDCEGCEGSILVSTPIDYIQRVRKIAMEFHEDVSILNHEEIQGLLKKAGFVTQLNWDGKSPHGYLYAKRIR